MNQPSASTDIPQPGGSPHVKRGLWRPALVIALVLLALVLAHALGVGERLRQLEGFIRNLGPWGPAAFFFLYVAATVAAIPGSALTLIAGGLFGTVGGTVVVSLSSTAGAALCFLIARYFARDSVSSWVLEHPRFQMLDRLTRTHGGVVVALTRLVPLFPFNLLNYGFGLTDVSFGTYVVLSWLCMLPGTVLYIAGGQALWQGLAEGRIPWTPLAIVLVLFVVLLGIVKLARKKLNSNEQEEHV